jgi:dTMP kinase
MFITFEGIDASGKTTNVAILADHLRSRGYKVITTREPGGNPIGDKIRELLLSTSRETMKMDKLTELLLFLASRNEHVQKQVIPHLKAGYVVICDRFHDSTYAYQGYARGMLEDLNRLGSYVNGNITPDITLFFTLPFEESVRRLELRREKQDRLDLEEQDFRRKVYDGYQMRLGRWPNSDHYKETFNRKVVQIDALPEPEVVSASIKAWANTVFENLN